MNKPLRMNKPLFQQPSPSPHPDMPFNTLIIAIDDLAHDSAYDIAAEQDSPNSPDFDRVLELARHNKILRLLNSYMAQLEAEIEAVTLDKENI